VKFTQILKRRTDVCIRWRYEQRWKSYWARLDTVCTRRCRQCPDRSPVDTVCTRRPTRNCPLDTTLYKMHITTLLR